MRKLYILGFFWIVASGLAVASRPAPVPVILRHEGPTVVRDRGSAGAWYQSVRASCNPVEVDVALRWNPPPAGLQGAGFAAACHALAGRIDDARARILALPAEDRWRAAGIVFEVGHPVADAGDDRAAGPIMELVVEFWPNHYMALYHAGAAAYAMGESDRARVHLRSFLEHYDPEDGWTDSARAMLKELEDR